MVAWFTQGLEHGVVKSIEEVVWNKVKGYRLSSPWESLATAGGISAIQDSLRTIIRGIVMKKDGSGRFPCDVELSGLAAALGFKNVEAYQKGTSVPSTTAPSVEKIINYRVVREVAKILQVTAFLFCGLCSEVARIKCKFWVKPIMRSFQVMENPESSVVLSDLCRAMVDREDMWEYDDVSVHRVLRHIFQSLNHFLERPEVRLFPSVNVFTKV